MKLFQRIFATFCMVIICAIFVASFSFWALQNKFSENHQKQIRNMEISLLSSTVTTLQTQGEQAVRKFLTERWQYHASAQNVLVIAGNGMDILGRSVDEEEIAHAYQFATKNPRSNLATIYYDPFGEEYLLFIRNFDKPQTIEVIRPLTIPGLHLPPVWHEFIILLGILIVGLLLAYIVANNISKPIKILENGMSKLAAGDLDTRISKQLIDRKDELATLGIQFDKMAIQLQKLVEKERHLLHHVSHEMRSPLARIQAIIGLIDAQPQKQEQYMHRLENEITRMDTLVEELLTLSRLETANTRMEKEPIAFVSLLEQIVEDSQAVAQQYHHNIHLNIKNINDQARFDGSERYLYRAFDNVIRNAMNYSPEGSTIEINAYEDKKNLHIVVNDNGPGVDEKQLPHIFTAFYRADSSASKPGTGLGLALAKHIIEQHNGQISAKNLNPNGLSIHFTLPKTYQPKYKDPQ